MCQELCQLLSVVCWLVLNHILSPIFSSKVWKLGNYIPKHPCHLWLGSVNGSYITHRILENGSKEEVIISVFCLNNCLSGLGEP